MNGWLVMRRWVGVLGAFVGVVLGAGEVPCRPARAEEPLSVEIVGRVPRADDSDKNIFVGIRFTIAPGWHVYWKNPGESGLPTKVAWELPAGFSAESVAWPRPSRFSPDGQPAMFGYEGEVVLISRITPPAEYRMGESIEVKARSSWLGCNPKSCVRGGKELREELSSDRSKPLAFFEEWLQRVPVAAAHHPAVRGLNRRMDGGLEVSWAEKVSAVEVLPELPLARSGWKIALSSDSRDDEGGMTTVTATPGEEPDPRPIPVVLLFRRAEGAADGIVVSVPPRDQELSQGVIPGGTATQSPSPDGRKDALRP